MKKILIILVMFILCACSSNNEINTDEKKEALKSLGYSDTAVAKIFTLTSINQDIFSNEYKKEKQDLIINEDFNEQNINEYEKYIYLFDTETVIYLVNNKIINRLNTIDIYLCYKDDLYIRDNTELYLKYQNDFSTTRDLVEWVNCKCYKKYYEETQKPIMDINPLLIVSKIYYIDTYEPDDLVSVDTAYAKSATWTLREEAYENYISMYEDAKEEGLDFFITSAYRSYEYQENLYNKYLASDSQERVDSYSARPGYSDHQTGLTVDILKDGYSLDQFGTTDEAKWLHDNSYKYGFIVRYPEDKQDITGYIPESWHFRYIGKEAAKICFEKGITFDEYYAYYIEYINK